MGLSKKVIFAVVLFLIGITTEGYAQISASTDISQSELKILDRKMSEIMKRLDEIQSKQNEIQELIASESQKTRKWIATQ